MGTVSSSTLHPDGELAPRDVVARAIAAKMAAQAGRPVFLDATGLRPTEDERREFLAEQVPDHRPGGA